MNAYPKSPRYTSILIVCALLLAVAGIITANVIAGQNFAFEEPLMMWIHTQTGEWFSPVAGVMHYVGKISLAMPVIILLVVWLMLTGRRDYGLFIGLGTLLPTLIMLAAKVSISRPRPEFWPRIIEETNSSFPSGHSTFSAALATITVLLCLRSRHRSIILLAGIGFAALMGYSRIYLGVHYPTDVWVGWTNGALTTLALYYSFFRKRFAQ
ncbi:phosphatase PAP2 family protein [Neisseria iguanae]|uniref:Phosphatase PAP2 family protein n=1 Tax=Neisseria iguanae TaxID=90242 RepID=A0A2P7U0H2_9NEIS|nr:phosphatase PAP2 family protein [Neisseria iguanae]PSJ80480.1 phosphatase PAP2 family protein [Neisseria iguanae]